MLNRLVISTVLIGFTIGVGPSAAQSSEDSESEKRPDIVASGFLGDLSDLEPYKNKPKQILVWKERQGVLAEYERFLIAKPLVYFHSESKAPAKGIDPEELQTLAGFLHRAVTDALGKGDYEVVDEAGPGVLVVRLAITDVDPVNPSANVGTKAVGVALGVGLFAPRADLGRAAIEVEMVDGESGRRVAAVAAAKEARRFGGVIKGAKRWGDVRAAFEKWGKQFRKQLDEAREGK